MRGMDLMGTLACLSTALGIVAIRHKIDWKTANTVAVNNVILRAISDEPMISELMRAVKG